MWNGGASHYLEHWYSKGKFIHTGIYFPYLYFSHFHFYLNSHIYLYDNYENYHILGQGIAASEHAFAHGSGVNPQRTTTTT